MATAFEWLHKPSKSYGGSSIAFAQTQHASNGTKGERSRGVTGGTTHHGGGPSPEANPAIQRPFPLWITLYYSSAQFGAQPWSQCCWRSPPASPQRRPGHQSACRVDDRTDPGSVLICDQRACWRQAVAAGWHWEARGAALPLPNACCWWSAVAAEAVRTPAT